MILKVHVKYLMAWINPAFVVLCADILLSTYGNLTDVQKHTQDGMCLYDISLCVLMEKKDMYVPFLVSH